MSVTRVLKPPAETPAQPTFHPALCKVEIQVRPTLYNVPGHQRGGQRPDDQRMASKGVPDQPEEVSNRRNRHHPGGPPR